MKIKIRIASFLFSLLLGNQILSQSITPAEILSFPCMEVEAVEKTLVSRGWQKHQLEIVSDSNYIRRSWEQLQQNTNIKSYFIYYEFQKDTGENYTIYQFADRAFLKVLKNEVKKSGYKQIHPDKKKKDSGSESAMYKERPEYYYKAKTKSLTIVKEVFYYGLNSFLVYSYKPGSAVARYIVETGNVK